MKVFSDTYSLTLSSNFDIMKSPYMTDGISGIDHVKYKSKEADRLGSKRSPEAGFLYGSRIGGKTCLNNGADLKDTNGRRKSM